MNTWTCTNCSSDVYIVQQGRLCDVDSTLNGRCKPYWWMKTWIAISQTTQFLNRRWLRYRKFSKASARNSPQLRLSDSLMVTRLLYGSLVMCSHRSPFSLLGGQINLLRVHLLFPTRKMRRQFGGSMRRFSEEIQCGQHLEPHEQHDLLASSTSS